VIGSVFDAETEKPLPGATVTLSPPAGSVVEDRKPLSGASGPIGEYRLRAPLGQRKTKLHWGRLLMSNVLALANPKGVTTETSFIEVSSLNVRVEKEGYLPYEGPVAVADARPNHYSIYLRNVYHAPAGTPRRSAAPEDRPRETLVSFTLEPAVARPGDTVKFRAHFLLPNDVGIHYDASAGGYRDLIPKDFDLPQVAAKKGDGLNVYFEKDVKLPQKPGELQDRYVLTFTRDGRTVPIDAPEPLLQVLTDDADRPAAEALARADEQARSGAFDKALETALDGAKGRPAYRPGWLYASRLAVRLHRWDDAADAAHHAMDLGGPGAEEAYDTYAEASLAAGKKTGEQVRDELAPLEKKLPAEPKDLKDRAEGYWDRAMGRAALAAGDWEAANTYFGKAALRIYVPTDLLFGLKVKQAEAAYAAKPDTDTRLSLARALLDSGRGDEALPHFEAVRDALPENPWVRLDLAEALGDAGRPADALPELERVAELSPDNAEVQASLGETLFRLHRYADALGPMKQALANSQGNGDLHLRYGAALYASGKDDEGLAELTLGSQLLRAKPEVRDEVAPTPWGIFYPNAKKRSSAGFQTPHARAAFRLLRAHDALEDAPGDANARLDAAVALAGLEAPEAALKMLDRLPDDRANTPAALRVKATAEEDLEDWEAARQTWSAVVSAAPEDNDAREHLARCAALTDGPDAARLALRSDTPMTPPAGAGRRMTLWD
jgi:tetratricopeptide (TPR) repeat protein